MQSSSHSPIHHRPAAISAHHSLSSYHQSSNNYGSVKVEDSHYNGSHHNHSHNHSHTQHSNHYSSPTLAPFHSTQESGWPPTYSERAHGHHNR
jgi:hypothetical protein